MTKSAQPITAANVLAALPGCWSDILDAMGYDDTAAARQRARLEKLLDTLVARGTVGTSMPPAEDTIFSRITA